LCGESIIKEKPPYKKIEGREPDRRNTDGKDAIECNFPYRLIDAVKNLEVVAGCAFRA
jgi:hypothetical protein